MNMLHAITFQSRLMLCVTHILVIYRSLNNFVDGPVYRYGQIMEIQSPSRCYSTDPSTGNQDQIQKDQNCEPVHLYCTVQCYHFNI